MSEEGSLAGKVAVVTGATSGLGRAATELFARRGAHVVGAARRAELGEQQAAELRVAGLDVTFVAADLRSVEDCRRIVQAAVDSHGRVDVLINNAGFEGDPAIVDSHLVTEQQWDDVVDTNLKGAFFCCRFALPWMREAGRGVILNISSINAVTGPARMAAYSASKAGLVQLSRTLAVEYVLDGVRINAVIVGGMRTPQAERTRAAIAAHVRGPDAAATPTAVPTQRRNPLVYEPEEVARVLALLCNDDALVTGATIEVDHAMTAGSMASTLIYMTSAGIWQKPY